MLHPERVVLREVAQREGQVLGPRHAGRVDEDGDHATLVPQARLHLDAQRVERVVDAPLTRLVLLEPPLPDEHQHHGAALDRVLDLLAPGPSEPDVLDVHEDAVPAEARVDAVADLPATCWVSLRR